MNINMWDKFTKSSYFSTLDSYDSNEVRFILNNFLEVVEEDGCDDISKIDDVLIFDILMSIAEESAKDPDFESFMVFKSFYDVVKAFLEFASSEKIIHINNRDLKRSFVKFESDVGLSNDSEKNDPTLPQWLEYVSNDISQYTQQWVDDYIKSPEWKHRDKGVTEELLRTVMSALTDRAYDEYRKTPKSWTKKAIHGVLTGYLVSNVGINTDDYQYVVPALTGLLTYVGDQGLVNETKINNFKRYLAASESEMIDLASDSNNFGPSKMVANKMMEQGIDFDDEKSVQAFIDQVNANGGIDSLRDGMFDDSLNSQLGSDDSIVYDPDPKREYLEMEHLDSLGNRSWSRDIAISNHEDGVQYGINLWSDRNSYSIPLKFKKPDVILFVSEVTDVLYAQQLETPDNWSEAAWKEFGEWLRKTNNSRQYNDISQLFTSLILMLSDEDVLSNRIAKKIIFSLQTKVVSLDNVKMVKGKLKKKKRK
ncbi:hypothetical protein [Companilactobacillus insicii]|uniref:hypothetical protein n=1 Tax=Companilactobacillus insicii TaxID=1732567 RepID=UPI000F79F68A|nr:hypothetical protein [Companilactobacillus insicii]